MPASGAQACLPIHAMLHHGQSKDKSTEIKCYQLQTLPHPVA